MQVFYEFICVNCGDKHDKLLHYKDIKNYIENNVCQKCGGDLEKKLEFGGAILRGNHFTKNIIY